MPMKWGQKTALKQPNFELIVFDNFITTLKNILRIKNQKKKKKNPS